MVSNRSNPILDTVETVPGYPSVLKIFRVPASRYWWTHAFMDGKTITKSTKLESKQDAVKAAKDFYNNLLLKKSQDLPLIQSPTFERVAIKLKEEDENQVKSGEKKPLFLRNQVQLLEKDILPYFRKTHVKDISYRRLMEFKDHLHSRGLKPLSASSVAKYMTAISRVLNYAWEHDLIDHLPKFPKIKTNDNPREWFSRDQYELLKTTIQAEVRAGTVVRYHKITDELYQITLLMVNSFLRPSDLKFLKNKHIEIVEGVKPSYLRIKPPSSKTVNAPIVTMEAAIGVYRKLLRAQGYPKDTKPEDVADEFVVFPKLKNRDFALQTLRRQFNHVLNKAGLKFGADDKPRTIYSLRHTAIMFRLTSKAERVDLLTLARNCRTSIDMIQRFYASHLQAEMNVENLIALRRRKQ